MIGPTASTHKLQSTQAKHRLELVKSFYNTNFPPSGDVHDRLQLKYTKKLTSNTTYTGTFACF